MLDKLKRILANAATDFKNGGSAKYIIFGLVFLTIVIVLVLTVKLWYAPLLLILLALFAIAEKQSSLESINQAQKTYSINAIPFIIYEALKRTAHILRVQNPKSVYDIVSLQGIISKNGFTFLKFETLKTNNTDLIELDTKKLILQKEINKLLTLGFEGFNAISFKGAPILWIDELLEDQGYLILHVAYIDNESIYNYLALKNKLKTAKRNSTLPNDKDF